MSYSQCLLANQAIWILHDAFNPGHHIIPTKDPLLIYDIALLGSILIVLQNMCVCAYAELLHWLAHAPTAAMQLGLDDPRPGWAVIYITAIILCKTMRVHRTFSATLDSSPELLSNSLPQSNWQLGLRAIAALLAQACVKTMPIAEDLLST